MQINKSGFHDFSMQSQVVCVIFYALICMLQVHWRVSMTNSLSHAT